MMNFKKVVIFKIIAVAMFVPSISSGQSSETNTLKDINPSKVYSQSTALNLSSKICGILSSSKLSTEKLDSILLEASGYKSSDLDYKLKLAAFWNTYSESIICEDPTGKYPEQHLYKRAISMKLQKTVLTNYFFHDEKQFPIDANAVQTHPNGEKTTVLDFLNKIIDDPNSSIQYNVIQLKGLRKILRDYYGATGAKG